MRPFTLLTAVALPLVRANVDTDAIIPSREMKSVAKTGLADGLFAGWRYTEVGGRVPNPEFVMNQPAFRGAEILLGGVNFGCGSSREHAAWALAEYGFRAILAPSFNAIFQNNCVRNGIAPVRLDVTIVEQLAAALEVDPQGRRVTVDLVTQTVRGPGEIDVGFSMSAEDREMLLEGLDAIDLTAKHGNAIAEFRARDAVQRPWAYL